MNNEIGKIGFIGFGNMASALIAGMVKASLVSADNIIASKTLINLSELADAICQITDSNIEVIKKSDIIVIAVKPAIVIQVLAEMLKEVPYEELKVKSFISIAAGVPLNIFETILPGISFIRVMPNTPCCVGECAAAYSAGTNATTSHKVQCEAIFKSVGVINEVPEKLMDVVTGLGGSGPAYVFLFIEALADGAVRMGLPRNIALQLAAQTVKGAATMCLETGLHPALLKDQVCSPGGTTIAGVEALEEHGFRAAAMSAVVAATKKSIELREASNK